MTAELVVGVDVGSQGTCAQAIAPDGERVATAYVPHTLSYPQPGWAEQDAREWLGAVAQALAEVRRAVDGDAVRAVSFGSQLDGLVAADADGRAAGPRADLDGPPCRSGVRGGGGADRARAVTRADRLQPRPGPRGREDRLAPRAPSR